MPRLSQQHASVRHARNAQARRALIEDFERDKKGWLQHGIAALAVSVLGLGVAGSVALTGAAEESNLASRPQTSVQQTAQQPVQQAVQPVTQSSTLDRNAEAATSRNLARQPLNQSQLNSKAKERAKILDKTSSDIDEATRTEASNDRNKELETDSAQTRLNAQRIEEQRRLAKARRDAAKNGTSTQTPSTDQSTTSISPSQPESQAPREDSSAPDTSDVKVTGGGGASMPIASGYRIAATFGQYGSWSRYHTGYDFSAAMGTPFRSPAAGVVTHVGYGGSAGGWAGFYVTVRHADGKQSLYAHGSPNAVVSVGQQVSAGQVVGHVGMTGRTFGPHLHFEIYPAGVTPGDVYKATNPMTWLQSIGAA